VTKLLIPDPPADGRPSPGERVPAAARNRRRGRVWGRAALVAAAVVLALGLGATVYELTLPGVGDAPARVARILRSHHANASPMPPARRLSDAIVAVEDEHFYSNFAVNVLTGAGRAALATLRTARDPGGSTIDQQLAKQLYGHGSGVASTLREIGLGVKLSLTYSQPRILWMYLNAVYFGNGYWGDEAAARGYFGVDPRQLSWSEAAMLAGLVQAPSAYDPVTHFAAARKRQHHVLDQLVTNHYLTRTQADAAWRAPLPLRRG
jgi:membrane peptidoglycan carboxypeptidase